MNIVILAAGQGKRMHSDLPKVLHQLAGRPLLAHVLQTASVLQCETTCVVYGHGGEQVKAATSQSGISWARQELQRGTGHAVLQAIPCLAEHLPTLILYGDVPLIRTETLLRLVAAAGDGMGILTVKLDDPTGYGRIVRQADAITRIVEEKDASTAERALKEINTGVMLVPTMQLKSWLLRLTNDNSQGEYYLTDIVAMAVAEGVRIADVQPADSWEILGVNSRADLARLERLYQTQISESLLEKGVTLSDPARLDVRGRLICGRDCVIDVNCIFEGEVVLGNRVRVGANSVLRNVQIESGTCIEPFCHIEEARIGENCRVGPYARLRPGTYLAEEVHVGNFVEVKASKIGRGTKANHLSYVGDSDVGQNVNIGAGTITCNYDGASKHRTVIEDDVFIGSNTQLIAPIRIGKGATIGAGSTITADTPEYKLTLSRSRQVTIPDWSRPLKKKN